MRILYVTNGGGVGGIQTYGAELAQGMRERGHQVETIDCGPELWERNLTLSDYLPSRFATKRYYWWKTSFLHDYRFHNGVARLCAAATRRFRPDLIHCVHSFVPAAAVYARVPSVVTCHGLEIENIPPVRASIEAATGVHCNSDFTRQRVVATFGDRRNIRVLRWGIKTNERQAPRRRYDLVTVGRVVRRKNLDTVLRALSRLPHLTYAIAGDGPELEGLKRLADDLNLSNVQFLGAISDDEKDCLLAESRAFIMCPLGDNPADVEGLGLVYYEAHGAGLPVIGSMSGGAPEAIGNGGMLVRNASDVEEVRAVIQRALEPPAYDDLVSNVAARQSTHSWITFMQAFESWYAEMIRSNASA
jgi:glycosyltransferase involved in cell wall biosynthesis